MLDRLRATFRWKVADLDADGLRQPLGTSTLTLAGLLKHLAAQEDYASTVKLAGAPAMGAPWDETGWDGNDDWEFDSAVTDSPESLYALYDGAVARSRARFDTALQDGLDELVHKPSLDGHRANLRRLLCDLVEEYGRHTGHADLLREAVDGRVGEDPPPDWRPFLP